MQDDNGREWAKLSNLQENDLIEIGEGYDCMTAGEMRIVRCNHDGFYINCDHGYHFLKGQLEVDGDSLIGLYKVQT